MGFPISENLGIDTLMIIIPVYWRRYRDFRFSYLAGKRCTRYRINHQFLKNAQGCQLGTLQILILHGLMISNQPKPIVDLYCKVTSNFYQTIITDDLTKIRGQML